MAITTEELVQHIKNSRQNNAAAKQALASCVLLLLFGLMSGAPSGWAADAQKLTSGIYEGLMLAVAQDGSVSGFYRESQGEKPSKTCTFFLQGKGAAEPIAINSWNSQIFPGQIKAVGVNVNLKIGQAREHPGCGLVLMPEIASGITLERTTATRWCSLKMVQSSRAALFSAPSAEKKTRAYFVKNDVLGVLAHDGEWLQVEFPRDGKASIKGWLKASDTQDLLPPKK
ncbi:MAG: hypothetical protein QFF03_10510 [Pseudomonadota bacterium]|nr:hypothetical protein [Pseudomonadota bacterium]